MKSYAVYAIGSALVDTEIQVTDADLDKLNIQKGVMTLVNEGDRANLLDQLSKQLDQANRTSGGSAGNSMIATALFGARTYMTCKVADDEDGDIYLADLEECGVYHEQHGKRSKGITGKCLVLITPDAERSLNTNLGVSETLSTSEVSEEAILESEWVYLEGYLVTSPSCHSAALQTISLAKKHGVSTAINFSDPGMLKFFRANIAALLEDTVELVFCNRSEALEWGQCHSVEDAIESMKRVSAPRAR